MSGTEKFQDVYRVEPLKIGDFCVGYNLYYFCDDHLPQRGPWCLLQLAVFIWAILSAVSRYLLELKGVCVSEFNHFSPWKHLSRCTRLPRLFLLGYLPVKSANKQTHSSFFVLFCFSHLSSVTLCAHFPYIYKIALGVVANACILEA